MIAAAQIETAFREEHGRVLAALISQLGDFTLAEDTLQDALVNASERWKIDGVRRDLIVNHLQCSDQTRRFDRCDNPISLLRSIYQRSKSALPQTVPPSPEDHMTLIG